jgi:hypothetical protein
MKQYGIKGINLKFYYMKKITLFLFGMSILGVSILQSCSKDDAGVSESIATDATFSGFTSWQLAKTFTGFNADLAGAHAGSDSFSTRKVYFKNGQSIVNGAYPIGTVIVKHVLKKDNTSEYVGMVKRGNNFNTAVANWEWFLLNANGSISSRGGATMMSGACNSCHLKAPSGKDFVFSK